MRSAGVWSSIAVAIPLASAATGAAFYAASFFGYGWPTGETVLGIAFGVLYLPWGFRLYLDRRFFLEHWGIGMYGVSQRFHWQMFPARRERWLNPLGRALFALLIVHFVINFAIGTSGGSAHSYAAGMLRLLSLMVVAGGALTALQWIYPPTLTPEDRP